MCDVGKSILVLIWTAKTGGSRGFYDHRRFDYELIMKMMITARVCVCASACECHSAHSRVCSCMCEINGIVINSRLPSTPLVTVDVCLCDLF